MRDKYVFVLPSLKIGGGNKVFIHLANELATNSKYEVSIYTVLPDSAGETNLKGMINTDVVTLMESKKRLSKIGAVIYFLRRLKTMDGFLIVSDPMVCSFLIFSQKKYIRFIQGNDYYLFDKHVKFNWAMLLMYKALQRMSYKLKNSYYVTNSDYIMCCLFSKPYYISEERVSPIKVSPSLSEEYFLKPIIRNTEMIESFEVITIGTVGRIHHKKGFNYFVRLANELSNSTNQLFKFIVMSHDDLSKFDLSNIKLFSSNTDEESIKFYDKCDIFVSTSLFEGFGMPPLEAMARGCACVLFDCEGYREYATDKDNSLIVPVGDYLSLYKEVIGLSSDKKLQEKLSQKGIQTARKFKWKDAAKRLQQALKSWEAK
ncbi:glycosyltransferase family 4 protein [Fangia hongkongensis]|uniref:glycosyltransferase family 4 protein n=1 Tax=Fangia hongkongensis TaxID=270495 RepID=UPI00039ADD27|nr:glycosyltransferase family 4 protein [Fangia hongkongensis]MBK2125901.1 glycosyltransferase family 4 protein [Fangia hongkongensis]